MSYTPYMPDLKKGNWTAFGHDVLRCARLPRGPKLLLLTLFSYQHDGETFASQETLAAATASSTRSVIRWAQWLVKMGLVGIKRRGLGKSNLYRLLPVRALVALLERLGLRSDNAAPPEAPAWRAESTNPTKVPPQSCSLKDSPYHDSIGCGCKPPGWRPPSRAEWLGAV